MSVHSVSVIHEDEQVDTLVLSDNGAGADLVAHDGLYSGFFVPPNQKSGTYNFKCRMQSVHTNDTQASTKVSDS